MRAVVVDDTAVYRGILRRMLGRIDGVEVVADLGSGRELVDRIEELRANVVVLDVEMPDLDGIGTLEQLAQKGISVPVLIVTGTANADKTLRALSLGALDVIAKPVRAETANGSLFEALRRGIHAANARTTWSHPKDRARDGATPTPSPPAPPPRADRAAHLVTEAPAVGRSGVPPERMIVLGASTGGPQALESVVSALDASFRAPMLIVQHMPAGFTRSLASSLSAHCAIEVEEARPGQPIRSDRILVAAGGCHLEIGKSPSSGLVVRHTTPPPVNGCRPAIDRLFRSVGQHFDGQVLAVILTGMGEDGLAGVRALRERGAYCIAQSEESCVVYGMPRAVSDAGLAHEILPLEKIGPRIQAFAAGGEWV